jgi:uncharacterized protein
MKHIIRFVIYIAGLFALATGINLAIKSNLGVSPISSPPLAISNIIGASLGTVTIGVYVVFVLAQAVILGKKFKIKDLLQIFFGFAFGYFVDFSAFLLSWVEPSNYFTQGFVFFISIIAVSIGVVMFITMDLVPNAPDGLVLAICKKTGAKFPKVKVLFDCSSIVVAVALSWGFLGYLSSIGVGTIISALVTGKVIGAFSKPLTPWLKKVAFYNHIELDKKQLDDKELVA